MNHFIGKALPNKRLHLPKRRAPLESAASTVSRAYEGGEGVVGSGVGSADPRLSRLIERWPKLDEATRAKIAALVDGHRDT
jgi:hypothetical protein